MNKCISCGALLLLVLLLFSFPTARSAAQTSYERVYLLLSQEGNIAVIDPGNGVLKRRIQVGTRPQYIAYNRETRKAYVSNTASNIISIVDVIKEVTAKIIHLPFEEPGSSAGVLALNPAKNQLYIAEYPNEYAASANIWVVDLATDEVVGHFAAGAKITSVSATADGKKIFVLNEGRSIGIYDAGTFALLNTIQPLELRQAAKTAAKPKSKSKKAAKAPPPPPPSIRRLTCHPVKNLVYVTYGPANVIQVINADTHMTERTIPVPELSRGDQTEIFSSADGSRVFIVNHKTDLKTANSVLILDTEKNEIVKLLDTGVVRNGVAVSANGKYLYTAGTEFKNFDLNTYELTRSVHFQTELGGMATIPAE